MQLFIGICHKNKEFFKQKKKLSLGGEAEFLYVSVCVFQFLS